MIVNDTERQQKVQEWSHIERNNQSALDLEADKRRAEKAVLDSGKTNPIKMWGRPLRADEFEKKLLKLNPKFRFEEFPPEDLKHLVIAGKWPANEPWHHKILFILEKGKFSGEDEKVQVCLYPRHILPEWSIMYQKEDAIPNPELISNPFTKATDADFGINYDPVRDGVDWNTIPKGSSLYKYFNLTNGCALRGWREILVICLREGFITLGQVELEFGAGNSAEWSRNVKGQDIGFRPW